MVSSVGTDRFDPLRHSGGRPDRTVVSINPLRLRGHDPGTRPGHAARRRPSAARDGAPHGLRRRDHPDHVERHGPTAGHRPPDPCGPGCDPPRAPDQRSWMCLSGLRSRRTLGRRPPHQALESRRPHSPRESRAPVFLHHGEIHRPNGWAVFMEADSHPSFIPPTYTDPRQRPQRNNYHRRE